MQKRISSCSNTPVAAFFIASLPFITIMKLMPVQFNADNSINRMPTYCEINKIRFKFPLRGDNYIIIMIANRIIGHRGKICEIYLANKI